MPVNAPKPSVRKRRQRTSDRASELLTLLFNGAVVVLLLVGFAGLVSKLFGPGGLAGSGIMKLVEGRTGTVLLILLGVLAAGYAVTRWFDTAGSKSKRGDILLYAGVALGLYFAFKLYTTGSF